jgi:hypothetical protein
MLKLSVEFVPSDPGGHRRVVASMSIASKTSGNGVGEHSVTVLEAEDPSAGEPPRIWTCTIRGPEDGGVWSLVRAAIDAMADAECAEL